MPPSAVQITLCVYVCLCDGAVEMDTAKTHFMAPKAQLPPTDWNTVKATGLCGAGACWDTVVHGTCASVGSFVTVWVSELFLSPSQKLIHSAVHILMPTADWAEM